MMKDKEKGEKEIKIITTLSSKDRTEKQKQMGKTERKRRERGKRRAAFSLGIDHKNRNR